MFACLFVSLHADVCIWLQVCMYMYVCMYVCMSTWMLCVCLGVFDCVLTVIEHALSGYEACWVVFGCA